jgi:VanZ family protein
LLQNFYKQLFWIGYAAVFITAFLELPWQLDKIRVGTLDFHIRFDHLLHLSVYFLICMYFYAGQRNRLHLFQQHSMVKFLILIVFLATITEIVQFWIPYRAFNPMDWVSNVSGVILGVVVMVLTRHKR